MSMCSSFWEEYVFYFRVILEIHQQTVTQGECWLAVVWLKKKNIPQSKFVSGV